MTNRPVRVRIAPSPTGDPHVGTAYIALFNYVFAKKHGGKFVLRIEDTDQVRSTKESEEAILRAIRWLGLSWDEGPDIGGPHAPYRQSERSEIYRTHTLALIAKGGAYRCFCSKERLDKVRAEQEAQMKAHQEAVKAAKAAGQAPPAEAVRITGYDRHCRNLPADESARRAEAGEPHVVRLAMPIDGHTVVKDRLRGAIEFDNRQIDDQVLLKEDGFPTYHLANVVDDHLMEITHVIRAEEWISSTPKHVALYQLFGWEAPEWIHMPLLRNKGGAKISKRKNPVSLDYYRDAGILPEALRNFLGLMGWSISGDREKFALNEMIEVFDIDRVHLGGPVFDLQKLWAMNAVYLRELAGMPAPGDPHPNPGSPEQLLQRLLEWRLSPEFLRKIVPLVQARMNTLADFVPLVDFLFAGDLEVATVAPLCIPKGKTAAEVADALEKYAEEIVDKDRRFDPKELEQKSRDLSTALNWKPKDLFMSLRVAVTGKTATPPLFETMQVLGRELTRRRLRLTAEHLRTLKA